MRKKRVSSHRIRKGEYIYNYPILKSTQVQYFPEELQDSVIYWSFHFYDQGLIVLNYLQRLEWACLPCLLRWLPDYLSVHVLLGIHSATSSLTCGVFGEHYQHHFQSCRPQPSSIFLPPLPIQSPLQTWARVRPTLAPPRCRLCRLLRLKTVTKAMLRRTCTLARHLLV